MKKILIFISLSFILLFSSCKQTEYIEVPVETIKTEYIVKKDSVYLRDSINVFTEVRGDTVYINKIKYQLKESVRTDTIMKTDSIPVVVKVKEYVKVNELYTWQRLLMYLGGVGIAVLIGFILSKIKIWKLLF